MKSTKAIKTSGTLPDGIYACDILEIDTHTGTGILVNDDRIMVTVSGETLIPVPINSKER